MADPEAALYTAPSSSSSSSSPPNMRRKPSYRALLGSFSSPRPNTGTARFFCESSSYEEERRRHRHFLDACSLCGKPLGRNRDVYMYRGDTPFCSEDCRAEQIELDEAEERMIRNSHSRRRSHHHGVSSSSSASEERQLAAAAQVHVRAAGTVVAG